MSVYDIIYRNVVFPKHTRRFAPQLLARIDRNRRLLESTELNETVSQRLNEIVVHAATTSPYWEKRFCDAGIRATSVRSAEDLCKLPLLEKVDVRKNLETMVSRSVPPELRLPDLTGGSTAAPLKFYRDPDCVADRVANEWVFFNWYGRNPFDRWGHIWGAQRDLGTTSSFKARLRFRLLDRKIVLPGNRLSESLIDSYVKEMWRFRPKYLHAYSQAVYFVAKYVLDQNRSVPAIAATTVTAEPISECQKKAINQAFSCRTFSIYGTREFGMIAAESPRSKGMHINPLNAIVEFIRPDGRPAEPGMPGQVVVTDLLNRATPMIRYRIGDIAVPIATNESGDLGLPRMELTAGRETDFVVTPDHQYIAGAALTLVSATGIEQLQYIQEVKQALKVRYIKNEEFHEDSLSELGRNLVDVVGRRMRIEFVEVDKIPLLPSGKLQYVFSDVARESLKVCQA